MCVCVCRPGFKRVQELDGGGGGVRMPLFCCVLCEGSFGY